MLNYNLIKALIFGVINGAFPGTVSTIIISETIKGGYKKGLLVAVSPLFFGICIVPFIFLLSGFLKHNPMYIGLISIVGGLYIFKLGIDHLKKKSDAVAEKKIW